MQKFADYDLDALNSAYQEVIRVSVGEEWRDFVTRQKDFYERLKMRIRGNQAETQ